MNSRTAKEWVCESCWGKVTPGVDGCIIAKSRSPYGDPRDEIENTAYAHHYADRCATRQVSNPAPMGATT